ncbi:hypothetical protein GF325_01260 [Candidatus Bathyarchaeota archaeon]|nr:hypothetical protein [Candidatus Bathyarchaeota archaeon]
MLWIPSRQPMSHRECHHGEQDLEGGNVHGQGNDRGGLDHRMDPCGHLLDNAIQSSEKAATAIAITDTLIPRFCPVVRLESITIMPSILNSSGIFKLIGSLKRVGKGDDDRNSSD